MTVDAKSRITLADALNHPWFKVNWIHLYSLVLVQ